MSVPGLTVPPGAQCALHPEVPAVWACHRCGTFICNGCERRKRADALPLCPSCWELRSQRVPLQQKQSETRLQTAGLVLGIISLAPFCIALQLGSVAVNIIAIVRAKEGEARKVRWRPIVGLCLTGVGLLIELSMIAYSALTAH